MPIDDNRNSHRFSPSPVFFAPTSRNPAATGLFKVPRFPASNESVALQSWMLINESDDIMAEVPAGDKKKVPERLFFRDPWPVTRDPCGQGPRGSVEP